MIGLYKTEVIRRRARGGISKPWNSRHSNGSSGSTTAGCSRLSGMCRQRSVNSSTIGSPKVHVGPEMAEGAPGGPVTGAFPGFSLGVLVMGQGPVEARGKRAVFSKARWARLCVRGAGSFHRACPFVTSGPRGALLHLPRVQLVKSRCPYDLRCTCVIFQPERWGPNSQTLAPLRVRAHRVIMLCDTNIELPPPRVKLAK